MLLLKVLKFKHQFLPRQKNQNLGLQPAQKIFRAHQLADKIVEFLDICDKEI